MKHHVIMFSILFFSNLSLCCYASNQTTHDKLYLLGLDVGIAQTNQLGKTLDSHSATALLIIYLRKAPHPPSGMGFHSARTLELNSLNNLLVGFSYHRLNNLSVNGSLKQGISLPLYSPYYQYTVQLSQLLAEIKLQHKWQEFLYFYFTSGAGAGFNAAKNFTTTIPKYLTITPVYSNNSNTSFSYLFGLGIETLINTNTTVAFGYLFSDLGQVGLGNGSINSRTVSNYLTQSHLYINTLSLQLNYYF